MFFFLGIMVNNVKLCGISARVIKDEDGVRKEDKRHTRDKCCNNCTPAVKGKRSFRVCMSFQRANEQGGEQHNVNNNNNSKQ